LLAFLRSL